MATGDGEGEVDERVTGEESMSASPGKSGRSAAKRGELTSLTGGRGLQKLTDRAYDELKAAILDLRLPPGTPLREAALAEDLGISKTPVREALAWLERDGLVETQVFKGAVVTGYSRLDLEEIYELREILEVTAARQAATNLHEVTADTLRQLSDECRAEVRAGRPMQLARLIGEFDSVLFDSVRNRRMQAVVANLRDHLVRIGHLTVEIPGRLESSVEEHDRIVRAIVAHDADAAAETMRQHIRSVRDDQLRSARLTGPDRSG